VSVHVNALVCVSVHVNALVCVSVHVNALVCVSVHVNALLCVSVHVNALVCVSVHVCALVCVSVHVNALVCVSVHVNARCFVCNVSFFVCARSVLHTSCCVHWTAGKIAEHYNRAANVSVWAEPVVLHATIVLHQQSGYTFALFVFCLDVFAALLTSTTNCNYKFTDLQFFNILFGS